MSKIEWTEYTWNPAVGCDKVSAGCKNCYAIRMAWRLAHMPHMKQLYGPTVKKTEGGNLNWTGQVIENWAAIDKPLQLAKPSMFFVNSMSDLFHKDVSFEFIDRVYEVMVLAPQHIYQVLTKRADRMVEYYQWKAAGNGRPFFDFWPLNNLWLGVSVESQKTAEERIPALLQIPAAIRWLSCEPLLGKVDLTFLKAPDDDAVGASRINALTGRRSDMARPCPDTNKISWVVCGGESGPDSRPMHPVWARLLRDQCEANNVPFFFKQWGDWAPAEGNLKRGDIVINEHGEIAKNYNEHAPKGNYEVMRRVGKAKATKTLDGKEHKNYPIITGKPEGL